MTYQCQGCGYRASKRFVNGRCPACDGFDIRRLDKPSEWDNSRKEPKTLFQLIVMVGLWSLLLYGFWDKYLQHWL